MALIYQRTIWEDIDSCTVLQGSPYVSSVDGLLVQQTPPVCGSSIAPLGR